jgi:hypothetical protein
VGWLVVLVASCVTPDADKPPRVPQGVQFAPAPTWGNCILSWEPDAPIDAYELKVGTNLWQFVDLALFQGIPGKTTSAELNFGSWNPELSEASVQIRARRGTLYSEYSEPVSCKLPIQPPHAVIAVVAGDGVALSWRSSSALATSFQVERSELDTARTPGAWTSIANVTKAPYNFDFGYADRTTSVGKAYGYRVTAIAPADHSEGRETATLILGAPLRETTIQLPLAFMVTDGRGHYAYAMLPQGLPTDVVRFTWGNGQIWTSVDVAGLADSVGPRLYAPGIKLDASGLPHVVYPRPQAIGGGVQIIHGWPDGAQWREETIAVRGTSLISSNSTQIFDLDTSDNPVVVWVADNKLEAAAKRAGAWEVTSLESVYPDAAAIQTSYVFTDHAGTAHLLVGEQNTIRHLQPKNGVWTSEALPVSPINLSIYSRVLGVGQDADHLAVFFQVPGPDNISTVSGCLRKSPTGWGAVERLGTLPFTGASWDDRPALSSDGRRLALLSQRGDRSTAHVLRSDDGGPWNETIATPWQFAAPLFTPSGKLEIFSYHYPITGGVVTVGDYLVEIEP